jgi:hypothetical protein
MVLLIASGTFISAAKYLLCRHLQGALGEFTNKPSSDTPSTPVSNGQQQSYMPHMTPFTSADMLNHRTLFFFPEQGMGVILNLIVVLNIAIYRR